MACRSWCFRVGLSDRRKCRFPWLPRLPAFAVGGQHDHRRGRKAASDRITWPRRYRSFQACRNRALPGYTAIRHGRLPGSSPSPEAHPRRDRRYYPPRLQMPFTMIRLVLVVVHHQHSYDRQGLDAESKLAVLIFLCRRERQLPPRTWILFRARSRGRSNHPSIRSAACKWPGPGRFRHTSGGRAVGLSERLE